MFNRKNFNLCFIKIKICNQSSNIFDTISRLLIQILRNEKQTLMSVSNNGENDRCSLAGSGGFRLLNDIMAYALVEMLNYSHHRV